MNKTTQHIRTLWNAVILAFLIVLPAQGSELYNGLTSTISPSNSGLQRSFYQYLVVSVDKLNDGPHNNANPPRGVFTVEEQLRGKLRAKQVELMWKTKSEEKDHVPFSEGMPVEFSIHYSVRPGTPDWQKIVFPPPPIGERIIVFAQVYRRPLSQSAQWTKGDARLREILKATSKSRKMMPFLIVHAAYAYSESNRQVILGNMGPTDRDPMIQTILVCILLSCTPLSVLLFAIAFGISYRKRLLMWTCTVALAPVSVLVWILFETGNVTGGIRIDLFIIFPSLGINVIMALAAIIAMVIHWIKHKREQSSPPSPPTMPSIER